MGKVFFDIGLSLDGFLAGKNRGPGNPLGDDGPSIHEWMFKQKAFWRNMGIDQGEEKGPDGKLIENVFARTGAYVMGKRMFEEGEVNWPEEAPFHAPVFVLTNTAREPWKRKGGTTFYFVNNGIESALQKARKAAAGKDIRISGGAHTIQQYLNAGLIDEFNIHLAPVFLGSGLRLFEHVDTDRAQVEMAETAYSTRVTHLKYNVINK